MYPTLKYKSREYYSIKKQLYHGDIIAFYSKDGARRYIKRIIGLSGDTVEGKPRFGLPEIYVNGVKKNENYINVKVPFKRYIDKNWNLVSEPSFLQKDTGNKYIETLYCRNRLENIFKYTLGDNKIWVMGDNRVDSFDSRYHGPIKISQIVSKNVASSAGLQFRNEILPDIVNSIKNIKGSDFASFAAT